MLRVLVVEDHADQADVLVGHLQRYGRENDLDVDVTVLHTAVEMMESHHTYDLIFLDIGLPGMSGMEAAGLLRLHDTETPIVFVTDLAQYAVEGYRVDALDFMVKPISYHDFKVRMDRAVQVIARREGESIFVRTRDGLLVVPSKELVFVEVYDHRLVYHLTDGGRPSHRGSLGDIEDRLVSADFVRISSSCLVNMARIRNVSGMEMTMSNGEVCYLSRTRRRAALEAIANYYGGNGDEG